MTAAGLVGLDALGLLLLAWVLNLVRLGRLYVGYAALFVGLILCGCSAASFPPLRRLLVSGVRVFFPDQGGAVLGFAFVLFLFVYILTQATILSNRLAAVVQDLAISRARSPENGPTAVVTETREDQG